jgi:hypothetical protein
MLRLDLPEFAYDPAYAAQVESFNGGAPENKYFKMASGQWHAIDRLLNFSPVQLLTERWLKDLNVNVVWSAIDDRLGAHLFPFAVCPFGDFLCFDYRRTAPRPEVVWWSHELSREDEPSTINVAPNFDAFVDGLLDRVPDR